MAASLFVAYKTAAIVTGYTVNLVFCVSKNFFLYGRNYRVYNRNGYSALGGIFKAGCLDIIKHYWRLACAVNCDTAVNNFTELFFAHLILNNIVIALDNIGIGILNRKGPLKVKLVSGVGSINKS